MVDWVNTYVGVPYKSKGRCREGWDCWGLVCAIYREQFGIALPSLAGRYLDAQDYSSVEDTIKISIDDWEEVETKVAGDVVLCRVMGYETHVGIYLGNGLMLHVMDGTDTHVVNLEMGTWKRRVLGYYRPKSEAIAV